MIKSKKLKSQQGFSVVEMLMAILILILTLSFIGGGVTVIKDAYLKITLRTEAHTLLSTIITAVSNELQSANDVKKIEEARENTYWSFYNLERGYRMHFENKNNNIYIKTEVSSEELPLLTEKTITNGLVPKIEDLTYENEVFTYTIKIYYKNEVYAEQEISIRPINTD
nr:hypothetical protein [uncultured Niameybacter sp.]